MNKKILDHYLKFSVFTNPGCYKDFCKKLPDDVKELGDLLSHSIIHPMTLKHGNAQANNDLKYGDMNDYPWWRLRYEDDVMPNAISMIAELLRLDNRGFLPDRKVENKLVITCRGVAILMASILKAKGIPCRVRSGFAPYFFETSGDHWINQYWDKDQGRWVTIDADGFLDFLKFDQYDMPEEKFDWSAKTWLGIRKGELDGDHFVNACGEKGLIPVLWELSYDFHCLMNDELIYFHHPNFYWGKADKLIEKDFKEVDELAELMVDPDKNFDGLVDFWETRKRFRVITGGLIGEDDHVLHY